MTASRVGRHFADNAMSRWFDPAPWKKRTPWVESPLARVAGWVITASSLPNGVRVTMYGRPAAVVPVASSRTRRVTQASHMKTSPERRFFGTTLPTQITDPAHAGRAVVDLDRKSTRLNSSH